MGMKARIALGAVVGVVVLGALSANADSDGEGGSNGAGSGGTGSAATGKQTDGGEDAGTKPEKEVAFEGNGDFQVGTDVKPGTYRTTGNTDGMCYWERAKDASGELDSLLANDNVTGTSYVTITSSDKIFSSSDCADWEAVDPDAAGSPAATMPGDGGMFAVGSDIAPGTYKSTGNTDDGCYWERDRDAEHGLESIIANDNVSGTALVTIAASDAYFKTDGCGDWTKTG